MSIGSQIEYFRKAKGLSQKELGLEIGLPDDSAEMEIVQYESGVRIPKNEIIYNIAKALNVPVDELIAFGENNKVNVFDMLFALEDEYGFNPTVINGEIYLKYSPSITEKSFVIYNSLYEWWTKCMALNFGRISKDEYNEWRNTIKEKVESEL